MESNFETKMWMYKKMGDSKDLAYLKALEATARSEDHDECVKTGKSESEVAITSTRMEAALILGTMRLNSTKIINRLDMIIVLLIIGISVLLIR